MKYETLWARLMANIEEPENEQSCWLWKGRKSDRGYGRLNIRVDGKHRTVYAHRLSYSIIYLPETEVWVGDWLLAVEPRVELTYDETVEHLCYCPLCINPDHFDPRTVSRSMNTSLRHNRTNKSPCLALA